ncbi:hypothetical protein DIPPA_34943 [Diplonema papillatum]|nr:hypothetical protein DIPPA_34943 [Diplonema papillatum]
MTNARMYTLARGAAAAVGLFGGLCLRKGAADAKTVGGLGDGLGGSWGVALDLDWTRSSGRRRTCSAPTAGRRRGGPRAT